MTTVLLAHLLRLMHSGVRGRIVAVAELDLDVVADLELVECDLFLRGARGVGGV